MSKGMKRFFMICTIVFAAGGVMAIAGLVSGGISDLDKLSDRYDWFIRTGKIDEDGLISMRRMYSRMQMASFSTG